MTQTEEKTEKKERGKVEDVSRRQLSDLFLHHRVCRRHCYTAKYQNRWIIGLNIEAVTHTHTHAT